MAEARYPFYFNPPAPSAPTPPARQAISAVETELGHKAIAELDAIKAEMARGCLTLDEKLALRERLIAAREMWRRAEIEAAEAAPT